MKNGYFGLFRKFISALMMLAFIVTIVPIAAEAADGDTKQALEFKKLDVSVMPEYDDPRVLIVNEGILVNKSSKPVSGEVSFIIPKNAEIGMACELVNGGQHSCQPWRKDDAGENDRLVWKITKTLQPGEEYPVFWEYYYTPAQGYTAPNKSIDIDLTSDYNMKQVAFTIVQPLKATEVKITPSIALSGQSSEGMNYYTTTYFNKPAGEKIPLNLAYTKSDPNPSKERPQDPNNPGPQGETTSSMLGGLGKPGIIFPLLIFILGLGIFVMYFLNQRKLSKITTKTSSRKDHKDTKEVERKAPKDPKELERKKARKMLLEGKISEETYLEIMADLED